MKTIALTLIFALAASASRFPSPTLKNVENQDGCCIPSHEFQVTTLSVTASWDVHGSAAGYTPGFLQVDNTHDLAYLQQTRIDPTPKVQQDEIWFTPGAEQGYWYMFIKIAGNPNCYVRNFTAQPAIFIPPCWQPPRSQYQGDVTVGTDVVSVWNTPGERQNTTTLVEMSKCLPTNELKFGMSDDNDWIEQLTTYVNPKLSIDDKSKFIPPTGCIPFAEEQHAAATQPVLKRMPMLQF
jgi:hypothetical protein